MNNKISYVFRKKTQDLKYLQHQNNILDFTVKKPGAP